MRKIILGILVVGSMLLASDKAVELKSNLFDLNKVKSEEMKSFLVVFEATLPYALKVVRDYYEAKTCTDEFYNKITKDELIGFGETAQLATLIGLSMGGHPNDYEELINDYRFMNCGEGKPTAVKKIIEKQN